jgi:hypothetical protein
MDKYQKYLYDTTQEIIKSLEWKKGFGLSEKLMPSNETYKLIAECYIEGHKEGFKFGMEKMSELMKRNGG